MSVPCCAELSIPISSWRIRPVKVSLPLMTCDPCTGIVVSLSPRVQMVSMTSNKGLLPEGTNSTPDSTETHDHEGASFNLGRPLLGVLLFQSKSRDRESDQRPAKYSALGRASCDSRDGRKSVRFDSKVQAREFAQNVVPL